MPHPPRALLGLLLVLAPTATASGEGLVQLTLNGSIEVRGGAPIEIQWEHWQRGELKQAHLRLHLAERTQAFDLAALLALRLRASGAEVLFPREQSGAEHDVHLFVEATTRVQMRLGSGLWSRLTVCEGAPASVHFEKPQLSIDGAQLIVSTSLFNQHSKLPRTVLQELEVDAHATPTAVCERLFQQGLSLGLVCDRPSPDRWTPVRGTDGGVVTGCSIELLSPGSDWGVEVRLAVPVLSPR